jgi:hypothetical protein
MISLLIQNVVVIQIESQFLHDLRFARLFNTFHQPHKLLNCFLLKISFNLLARALTP